jgi:hypothetical protein
MAKVVRRAEAHASSTEEAKPGHQPVVVRRVILVTALPHLRDMKFQRVCQIHRNIVRWAETEVAKGLREQEAPFAIRRFAFRAR